MGFKVRKDYKPTAKGDVKPEVKSSGGFYNRFKDFAQSVNKAIQAREDKKYESMSAKTKRMNQEIKYYKAKARLDKVKGVSKQSGGMLGFDNSFMPVGLGGGGKTKRRGRDDSFWPKGL